MHDLDTMSSTSDTSQVNKSFFNWEANGTNQNHEETPYLEWKKLILGTLLDPLDEFLAIPNHSPAKRRLPRLFHPLCSNKSVLDHISETFSPLNYKAVWLDDSSPEHGRRKYSGPMTDVEFLKNLKIKVLIILHDLE